MKDFSCEMGTLIDKLEVSAACFDGDVFGGDESEEKRALNAGSGILRDCIAQLKEINNGLYGED